MHSQLPLLPEKLKHLGNKVTEKLLTTLTQKTRYIVHYVNLKQALNLGIKLTKIHRILKFKQTNWLAPYTNLNTKHRAKQPF